MLATRADACSGLRTYASGLTHWGSAVLIDPIDPEAPETGMPCKASGNISATADRGVEEALSLQPYRLRWRPAGRGQTRDTGLSFYCRPTQPSAESNGTVQRIPCGGAMRPTQHLRTMSPETGFDDVIVMV